MIGAALGWKYNYVEGIETRDGIITKWPSSLGEEPNKSQLEIIEQEYKDYLISTEITEDEIILEHIRSTITQEQKDIALQTIKQKRKT